MAHTAAHRAQTHGRNGSRFTALLVMVGLLLGCGVVWESSNAAFSGATNNSNNTWTGGQVSISDDDSGAALFGVGGLVPGNSGTQCILVTYTGNVASTVKLYATNYTGTLGPYLNVLIEAGAGTTCASFGSVTTLFSGTLNSLRSSNTNFATGLPAASPWNPLVNGAAKPYQFTYTLADDNTAQSGTATVDFVWEAHST